MKLLITGICGFVGSSIALQLQEESADVQIFGLDNLSRRGSELNWGPLRERGIKLFHGDARLSTDIDALPPVDWVIDAAANPSVLAGLQGASSSRQVIDHNLYGTVNILEYCRRAKSGLILLSTSRVYSIEQLNRLPLAEGETRFEFLPSKVDLSGLSAQGIGEQFSCAPPISLYGSTKLCSEALALEFSHTFGFPVWINRCGVLAGAGQFGTAEQGIFSFWIHAWKAGRPLRYIGFEGRGLQVRDALHPRDLASLIKKQLRRSDQSQLERTVNIAGGLSNSMSLLELSAWCSDRFHPGSVQQDTAPRPFDVPWLVLDTNLAHQSWGWSVSTKLSMILEEIAQHAETNPNWLTYSRG
jgi:CDP-paratose 2-epimerase